MNSKFKNIVAWLFVAILIAGGGIALAVDMDDDYTFRSGRTVDFNGTVDLTDSTLTAPSIITQTHIADKVWRIPVYLASVFVDGTGPITNATAPNLTTVDNVGAIVYDDSTETSEIQFSWFPDTNVTAMTVKLLVSSSDSSGADNSIDWSIFVHGDDVNLPSATAQTHATLTSATLDVSEELVTLTLDATGLAAITAGTSGVTIALWNQGTGAAETLEIKAIWIEETR